MSHDALTKFVDRHASDDPLLFFAAAALLVALGSVLSFLITKRIVVRILADLAKRTKTQWDDVIIERGILDRLAWLAPALILYFAFYPFRQEAQNILQRLVVAYMIVVLVRASFASLDAVEDIYRRFDESKARRLPIKGYLQIAKLLLFLIAAVVVVSNFMGTSPWAILTGLGAASAVLMLVFKDTILSFVASIQIATHDMMRIGDWIAVEPFGADGQVIDMALHVVRVQNWDKTITNIPTHKFMEQAFKNWRGMEESGGRRLKRSLFLDQSSIRFLEDDDLERLGKIEILREYLDGKVAEIAEHNRQRDSSSPANVRRLTNIGTFRAYAERYLRHNQSLHQQMSLLVRQLQPTPQGLPLEIYAFTTDTRWEIHEAVQGDIFDHLLAILPEFGLHVFQDLSDRAFDRSNQD